MGGESFRSTGQSLNRFSLFDEHEISSNVMGAIESTYNPYIIIHSDWNGENQYYLKALDDELIALLDRSPSLDLAKSLNLRNSIPVDLTLVKSDTPVMSIGEICFRFREKIKACKLTMLIELLLLNHKLRWIKQIEY